MQSDSCCGTHAQMPLKTTKARLPASQLSKSEAQHDFVRNDGRDSISVLEIVTHGGRNG
jgi:hypothetical protein